ncbi:MAG: hypothetical protein K6G00_09500 [Treponema sp.]|nr:hypothetical protein [Treponema sp.]
MIQLVCLLLEENLSYAAIGIILGRNKSTVSGEARRNIGKGGKEFACHAGAAKALGGIQFHFPGPHQPWQRGANENSSGLLREYFPKGADIGNYSGSQIKAAVNKLNKRPRKGSGLENAI